LSVFGDQGLPEACETVRQRITEIETDLIAFDRRNG